MVVHEFRQLDEVSLVEYIKATPCLSSKLGNKVDHDMQIELVDEGFMNFVYIVTSSGGSMVIKQALPYARGIGESWPITRERAKFEAKALQIYASLSPSQAPQLYHFDPSLSLIAMEYLEPPYILLRRGLIAGIEYHFLAQSISDFLAKVLFYSSLLYTSTTEHKKAVAEFCGNSEMTRQMNQLIFAAFEESELISWTSPELDDDVRAVQEDNTIQVEAAHLKIMFLERAQALIHVDLHAGAIMVSDDSMKVIDPEFASYGPIGYDVGTFFRNLIVSFFAQDGLADHQNDRQSYKRWLLKTLEDTWSLFQQKFTKLWDEHKNDSGTSYLPQVHKNAEPFKLFQNKVMEDIFQDALGYCATYVIGSVMHVGPVEDFDSIPNVGKRADCERKALNFGKMLLKDRKNYYSISDVVSSLEQFVH